MKKNKQKNVYLDYAASTPIDQGVLKKINFINANLYANPSAIHKKGIEARRMMDESKIKIANLLNVHVDEIIFTGGGTESVALALLGLINNYQLLIKKGNKIPHIVTTNIEHPAVLKNCQMLEDRGLAEITYVAVEANGIVNPKNIREAIKENTFLVTVMYANNEIGTIQPIREIAKEIRHYKKVRNKEYCILGHGYFSARHKNEEYSFSGACELDGSNTEKISNKKFSCPENLYSSCYPIFHTDACQAMNYLETDNMERLGVDMLSFNSSKIYGPKGIGILYKKRNIGLSSIYQGGGQEFGLRSGTENVSGIAGLAEALSIVSKIKNKESQRLIKLRDYAIKKILNLSKKNGYEIKLNGDAINRLPNNINISISGIKSELLVIELDALGIYVSEKSACHSESGESSYVIEAIRKASAEKNDQEEGSIRISLGRQTKKEDIDYLVFSLKKIIEKYRNYKQNRQI